MCKPNPITKIFQNPQLKPSAILFSISKPLSTVITATKGCS